MPARQAAPLKIGLSRPNDFCPRPYPKSSHWAAAEVRCSGRQQCTRTEKRVVWRAICVVELLWLIAAPGGVVMTNTSNHVNLLQPRNIKWGGNWSAFRRGAPYLPNGKGGLRGTPLTIVRSAVRLRASRYEHRRYKTRHSARSLSLRSNRPCLLAGGRPAQWWRLQDDVRAHHLVLRGRRGVPLVMGRGGRRWQQRPRAMAPATPNGAIWVKERNAWDQSVSS